MRRLGSNYVLDQRIGRGAQGEVWRGRSVSDHQEDGLGPERTQQDVLAFKVLRADLVEDEGLVGRFVKERTTLTRIRSPYVVNIRDFVIEGTTFAIVMDYVPGGDLRGKLTSDGPLPPAEVARIGAHVARGLMAVHAAGVVHRDVKPANILLDSSTDPATPRVVDFGIARIHNAVGTDHLTGILGTPLYMAPEILLGEVPRPASDLYSLGIVLYQSCCGVTPFVGDPGQLLGQHVGRLPGRPEGIPDSLWGILNHLLAKRPEQRPTAQQVAHDLEELQPSLEGLLPAPRIATPPASAPSADSLAFGGGIPPTTAAGPRPAQGYSTTFAPASSGGMASPAVPPSNASYQYPAYTPATAASGQSGQYRLVQPPGGYPPPRRRRRGWKIAVAAVLAVALTGAGVLAVRHFLFNGPDVPGDSVAALPAGKGFSEQLRLPNGYKQYVSPDGGMLAVESDKWAVYRLDGTKSEPVWKGDCYAHMSGFWDDSHFLCADSHKRELISSNGKSSTPPGPSDSRLKGATADRTVLTAAYTGDLLALDRNGKEVWRTYGKFFERRHRHREFRARRRQRRGYGPGVFDVDREEARQLVLRRIRQDLGGGPASCRLRRGRRKQGLLPDSGRQVHDMGRRRQEEGDRDDEGQFEQLGRLHVRHPQRAGGYLQEGRHGLSQRHPRQREDDQSGDQQFPMQGPGGGKDHGSSSSSQRGFVQHIGFRADRRRQRHSGRFTHRLR